MSEKDKADVVEVVEEDPEEPPPPTYSSWAEWVTSNESHLEEFAGPEKDRKTTRKSSLKDNILKQAKSRLKNLGKRSTSSLNTHFGYHSFLASDKTIVFEVSRR